MRTPSSTDHQQQLQACEVALEGLLNDSKDALVWFTTQVLKLPASWLTVCGQALIDKDRSGIYRWKTAKNPVGLLRTVARRIAGKSHPELLGYPHQTSLSSAAILPLSQVSNVDLNGGSRARGDAGGNVSQQDLIDRLDFQSMQDGGWDDYSVTHDVENSFRCAGDLSSDFDYDWDKIGKSLRLTADQISILRARASGVTREAMAEFLHWDQTRVERVWKSVNRLITNPATEKLARQTLLDKFR